MNGNLCVGTKMAVMSHWALHKSFYNSGVYGQLERFRVGMGLICQKTKKSNAEKLAENWCSGWVDDSNPFTSNPLKYKLDIGL